MSYLQNFCNWFDNLSDLNFALIIGFLAALLIISLGISDKKGE
jgi:hypothetical protein